MDTTRPSLLLRIRDHDDETAWRTFDAIYRPMLFHFARARGLSEDDAEEVAQHCMTVVSDQIGRFSYEPKKGRFKSWLRTLVNNRIRYLLRNRKEYTGRSFDLQHASQDENGPDEVFERIWLEEHLWHCLGELENEVEEHTFKVFRAYVFDERPVEEVCKTFHVAANNVYTIKWRMTERVAAKMKELLDGSE